MIMCLVSSEMLSGEFLWIQRGNETVYYFCKRYCNTQHILYSIHLCVSPVERSLQSQEREVERCLCALTLI